MSKRKAEVSRGRPPKRKKLQDASGLSNGHASGGTKASRERTQAGQALTTASSQDMWLPYFGMTWHEMAFLPELAPTPQQYLKIRNFMLARWHARPCEHLVLHDILAHVPRVFAPAYLDTVCNRVFSYLQVWGHINSGALRVIPRAIALSAASRRVVVIGAGISGLACARHLARFGLDVVVLEARARAGGRILTTSTPSGAQVDLGASIITGLHNNPLTMLLKQTDTKVHRMNLACPILDQSTRVAIPECLDKKVEAVYNAALAKASQQRKAAESPQSLAEVLEKSDLSGLEHQVYQWHLANLEYGCGGTLNEVSLQDWDQDDAFAFLGDHTLVPEGYSQFIAALADGLNIRYHAEVSEILWSGGASEQPVLPPTSPCESAAVILPQKRSGVPGPQVLEMNPPEGWTVTAERRMNSDKYECDIYYYPPDGKRLRSIPDIIRYLKAHPSVPYVDIEAFSALTWKTRYLAFQAYKDGTAASNGRFVCTTSRDASRSVEAVDPSAPAHGALASSSERVKDVAPGMTAPSAVPNPGGLPRAKQGYTVGAAVEVLYDDGEWYAGWVAAHDVLNGTFLITFDDGDTQSLTLPSADVRLVDSPLLAYGSASRAEVPEEGVTVVLASGEEVEARAVVVTIPLGVLQEETVRFTPSLPAWKSEAVHRLGNGLINKVVLEFEHVFWDPALEFFGIAPSTEGSNLESRGALFLVVSLVRCSSRPLLMGFLAGNAAVAWEHFEGKTVAGLFVEALRRVFDDVPEPLSSHVTRWGADRFARGAYSFMRAGGRGAHDYDLLSESLRSQVYFAGESTCREHPATAAGAFLSGLREAGKVVTTLLPDCPH